VVMAKNTLAPGMMACVIAAVAAGCADPEPVAPSPLAVAEQTVITQCPYLDPASSQFYTGAAVRFDHELVINAVSVVDDPCRTTWTGSCAGGGISGLWTFGEMMQRIAGTGSPQQLVANWLHQWEVPIVVNGFTVPPRSAITAQLIAPWQAASGCPAGAPLVGPGACPLDLQRAPFRLLAIVNRSDLECGNYPAAGDGEARLVFGALDRRGNPLQATVIFEFTLPPQRGGAPMTTQQWQNAWHPLSSMTVGSAPYLAHLERLINDITAVGANPSGPNLGTSLGQVRTNEIAFGGPPWKLRETRLQNTGAGFNAMELLADTTAETPDDSFNPSAPLDAFLSSNAPLLATFQQPAVPAALLGGESSAPLGGPTFWDHSSPSPLAPIERHHFALKTCNGCHFDETDTAFVHIAPRALGSPSALSPFLAASTTAAAGGLPALTQTVFDPAPTGAVFSYNEPWRRVCEASRMLQGSPRCWSRGNGDH
jgi:hypothetical protein